MKPIQNGLMVAGQVYGACRTIDMILAQFGDEATRQQVARFYLPAIVLGGVVGALKAM